MKAKRTKGGNRNSKPKDHGTAEQKILENGELTVQKLSSEVAGRTQKYTKLGAREFVRFPYTEVTIDHIKDALNGPDEVIVHVGVNNLESSTDDEILSSFKSISDSFYD